MSEKYKTREQRKKGNAKGKKKSQMQVSGFFKKFILTMLVIGIIAMITGATTFFVLAKDAPPLDSSLLKDPLSSKVYDMNGDLIAELGIEKRTYVSYNEIPELVRNAFIATEDVRFYEHNGIDIIRFGGAVLANITDGFGSQGASTITQQVVKNYFLTPEKTLKRKAQELWLSFQLESKYSKEEILEIYLNKILFGGRTHGVAKAAETYFGKELSELELHEAALLAGIPQSPNNYNPFNYPEAAEKRRNTVLSLMDQHGFISTEEANMAKEIPVQDSIVDSKPESVPIDTFLDQVKLEIKELGDIDVYSAGLEIYTTFDPSAQAQIDQLLASNDTINYPNEDFQAGIALLDTTTGEIRALGGGRNQSETSRINFALDPLNQPGSTIKPILDYGPAIEYLKWSTYHQIDDEPYTYANGTPIKNWDGKHLGQMSIRTALAKSRNIPALKAIQAVGLPQARDFAVSLGIPLEEQIYEPYSIGGISEGISPLQMAGAYSAFGNKGIFIKPHAIKKIIYPDDTEVTLSPKPESVMEESTAFMITDMLKSVMLPGGTASGYNVSGLHIAGKTGTTNFDKDTLDKYDIPSGAVPDAWFVGYTPNYTAAVWTGYRDNTEWMKTREEQQIAKQLFKTIITTVSEGKDTQDFPVPNSVVEVGVENGSNPAKLASEYTPEDKIIYEYFVRGTEPTEVSDRYKELLSPTLPNVNYDQTLDELTLTWSYPEEEREGVSFEISESIDEGAFKVISSQKEMILVIPNPIPEAKYMYSISAISDENPENRSEPATIDIEIPSMLEDELDIIPDEDEDQDENENEDDPTNGDDDGNSEDNDPGITDPGIVIPPGRENDEE
ncbi:PBP1A family penicillin-binding protein [Cytobacillus sp. S13-E01]|uniref:transglycosylase domain-containing protein n=1 Tax=Cytobacillus sp. S13-E01 TaxID=3031326 RepID=UPI0023D7ED61|nr:PBP1A family penicillin-binding protein [Cytobacillus sp. S13-E01]MDF0726266.1 PBP1A family penicillin-binding protein [Cytobacillus sp. S13-E01]